MNVNFKSVYVYVVLKCIICYIIKILGYIFVWCDVCVFNIYLYKFLIIDF